MAKITAPVKGFTGRVVGVTFADGVGETSDEHLLTYFRRHGYTVEGAKAPAKGKSPAKTKAPAKGKSDEGSAPASADAAPASGEEDTGAGDGDQAPAE